jgi:proline iminopeptidase
LAYPERVSHLILLDTGGEGRWPLENAADLMARRGFSPKKAELVRRWFNGEFEPREMLPIFMRIADAYPHQKGLPFLRNTVRALVQGGWRWKPRPEAMIFCGTHLDPGWSVMDRLAEITAPTLVMAGRDDFIFPPEHQAQLAAGIPDARLHIVERAGHNPHYEQTAEVMDVVRRFVTVDATVVGA